MSLKDAIYDYFVRKNKSVQNEYENYVMGHLEEHDKNRAKHWRLLLRLNWHYRILGKSTPLLAKDKEICHEQKQCIQNKKDTLPKQKNNEKKIIQKRPNEPQRPLPYLEGPESTALKRTPVHAWVKGLFEYEYISFDIFDTLILRTVNDPKDAFDLLAMQNGIIDFSNIRKQAEKNARIQHNAIYGNTEINIFDIYRIIEKETGLPLEKGVKEEFELECNICYANPYMKRAFDVLKARNKKIYAISDMYYPKEYMEKLLEKCGYDGFEDILVSCDYKGGKRNGVLFEAYLQIIDDRAPRVHIGDNWVADIQKAKELGFDTRFYENVQTRGNMYREPGMSPMIRSTYRGVVNAKMHIGVETYSQEYEFGYLYGGIFVLGYVNWLHQRAIEKGIDCLLFMARDGYIYKKIYDKLFNDVKSEYVYWSRVASLKYAAEYNREDFLARMIDHRYSQKMTIESMLNSIDLGNLIDYLPESNLSKDELVHPGNKQLLIDFFVKNWDLVLEQNENSQEYAKKYYIEKIGAAKKVGLVDIGWRGDNQLGLKWLIEKKWGIDAEVFCFMAATICGARNQNYMMNGTLEAYMFSTFDNRNLFDTFVKNSTINMAIFEMFSQAPFPSFAGFGKNGELEFGYAEVENYSTINNILKGIEDFCDDYIENFKRWPSLLSISGYDAFIPFRGITRQYRVAKNAIGNVRFQQGVGIDRKKQTTKTLLQVMAENNI